MVPTINVFADSFLLVEYIKETKTDLLEFLIGNSETIYINNAVMKSYNLLPNDALILATCLHHSLPYLASYDTSDFATACQVEGITLLDSVATAQQHLTQP